VRCMKPATVTTLNSSLLFQPQPLAAPETNANPLSRFSQTSSVTHTLLARIQVPPSHARQGPFQQEYAYQTVGEKTEEAGVRLFGSSMSIWRLWHLPGIRTCLGYLQQAGGRRTSMSGAGIPSMGLCLASLVSGVRSIFFTTLLSAC
jgi:hypothetical protein